MGIHELTSFVEDNAGHEFWDHKREVRGRLVVDGNNVLHNLRKVEWSNGGQYREFRAAVRDFYSALQRSGISPIVIFDGVDFPEKERVLMQRKRVWVHYIHKRITDNSTRPNKCLQRILPLLCGEVYRMVLHDMGIQFYVADDEGDVVIARVANYYSCPVLSQDSDFFVFHLIGGYIPFNHFYWESRVVTADIYRRDRFAKHLKFEDSDLLCAIPAIVGNDFLGPCSSAFIQAIVDTVPNGGSAIRSICLFLSQFLCLDDYYASEFGGRNQESRCRKAVEWYSVYDSLSCEELVETTLLTRHDGIQLPHWLIKLFHQGHVPSAPLEAAVSCKILFRMIPDNFHKESSLLAGQVLRQHMYALLGCEEVVEIFRHGLDISGVKVSSTKFGGKLNRMTVSSLQYLSHSDRQSLFYTIMQCDERAVSQLTGKYHDWKFVAATATLWAATTAPSESLVKALLLCFTICSGLNDDKLASLRRKCRMPVGFRQSQKWLDVMHSYVEWQVIYHTAWTLNALLMEPMCVFSPAFLYDGEIAMYLVSAEQHIGRILVNVNLDEVLHTQLEKIVFSAHMPTSTDSFSV